MDTVLNQLSSESLLALKAIARKAADENYPDWRNRLFLPFGGQYKTLVSELHKHGIIHFQHDASQLTPLGCKLACYLIG